MLLKYFYDSEMAHASYLVGCQKTGEAIVIDPARNVAPYEEVAAREGMRIVGAAETHIHADFVSGARELAEKGAKLFISDEGPDEWKYQYASEYRHQLLRQGDVFSVGNLDLEVVHTPGHTPESISFLLTDRGGGATSPMGIFTGDFVFVGAVGRPDLLEEAAGIQGTAEPGARALFQSLQQFKKLPDYLQVWPAHGAGSACGKGLGAIPSTTVGYEVRNNPGLQFTSEDEFVAYVLADQPEAPLYFAEMKKVNKLGPQLWNRVAASLAKPTRLADLLGRKIQVIDTRSAEAFAAGHAQGTINIPLSMLAQWGGWLIDYGNPFYLLATPGSEETVLNSVAKIGADQLKGILPIDSQIEQAYFTENYTSKSPMELFPLIRDHEVSLLDVRNNAEWNLERIDHAQHQFLGNWNSEMDIPDGPVVVQCLSGGRSAIAASILQSMGREVINMAGGILAWKRNGLPLETSARQLAG